MLDKTWRELIYFSITNPVKLMMSSERMNLYCLLCNGTFIPFVSDWLLKTNKLQLKFTYTKRSFWLVLVFVGLLILNMWRKCERMWAVCPRIKFFIRMKLSTVVKKVIYQRHWRVQYIKFNGLPASIESKL